MKIIKSLLTNLVVLIFGLEVGGFTMWYLTLKSTNEAIRRTTDKFVSHRSYYNH